jgi:hypothetical protein
LYSTLIGAKSGYASPREIPRPVGSVRDVPVDREIDIIKVSYDDIYNGHRSWHWQGMGYLYVIKRRPEICTR